MAEAHDVQYDLCVAKCHMVIEGTKYSLTRYDEAQNHLEQSLNIPRSIRTDDSNPSASHASKVEAISLYLSARHGVCRSES